MKYQMTEYQEKINQLRSVRPNLNEKTIVAEIQKIASQNQLSIIQILINCINLAIIGEKMAWE